MRHGAAEDIAPTGHDADRRLTPAGRATVRRVAVALRQQATVAPRIVVSSPYARATETAEIVRAIVCPDGDALAIEPDLVPNGSAYDLVLRIARRGVPALLVGHQPNIEAVARSLSAPAGTRWPGFRTSTVVILDAGGQPPPFRFAGAIDPSELE